jgi:hypothetical protein
VYAVRDVQFDIITDNTTVTSDEDGFVLKIARDQLAGAAVRVEKSSGSRSHHDALVEGYVPHTATLRDRADHIVVRRQGKAGLGVDLWRAVWSAG